MSWYWGRAVSNWAHNNPLSNTDVENEEKEIIHIHFSFGSKFRLSNSKRDIKHLKKVQKKSQEAHGIGLKVKNNYLKKRNERESVLTQERKDGGWFWKVHNLFSETFRTKYVQTSENFEFLNVNPCVFSVIHRATFPRHPLGGFWGGAPVRHAISVVRPMKVSSGGTRRTTAASRQVRPGLLPPNELPNNSSFRSFLASRLVLLIIGWEIRAQGSSVSTASRRLICKCKPPRDSILMCCFDSTWNKRGKEAVSSPKILPSSPRAFHFPYWHHFFSLLCRSVFPPLCAQWRLEPWKFSWRLTSFLKLPPISCPGCGKREPIRISLAPPLPVSSRPHWASCTVCCRQVATAAPSSSLVLHLHVTPK